MENFIFLQCNALHVALNAFKVNNVPKTFYPAGKYLFKVVDKNIRSLNVALYVFKVNNKDTKTTTFKRI